MSTPCAITGMASMDAKVQPLSAREAEIMMDGPALFCNRVLVNVGAVVRITFAEQEPGTKERPEISFSCRNASSRRDCIVSRSRRTVKALRRAISDNFLAFAGCQSWPRCSMNLLERPPILHQVSLILQFKRRD